MQVFLLSVLIYGFAAVFNSGLLLKTLLFYPTPPMSPGTANIFDTYVQIQNQCREREYQNQSRVRKTDVVLYTDELRYRDLRRYISTSEPFVLDEIPDAYFEFLIENYPIHSSQNSSSSSSQNSSSFIQIQQYTFPRKLGKTLDALIYRLTKKPVVYMASFSGNYISSYAHIDSFSSYNFYYLKKGRKEIYIVPHEYSHLLQLERGSDNVFVSEDDQSADKVRS